jgi:FMN reductase
MRIVGIGGSTRDGSSTEVLVRAVLDATGEHGGETTMFAGQALVLPPYEPGRTLPKKARELLEAVREADGLVFGSPGYHGTMSGLVKNALDYLEELARDARRPYVDGLPVACVVTASGWQAAVNTLRALRETVHALRGWPTPLGLAVNVAEGLLDERGHFRDSRLPEQIQAVATQLVTFVSAAGHDTTGDVPISAAGAMELVAQQVRRAIAVGRYAPGDRLPSAGEIGEQLGVAPETARRALDDLAERGVVEWPERRHDRAAVVGARCEQPAGLETGLAEFEEVIDFRIANECAAARLAAARRGPQDLAALRDALERLHRAALTPARAGAVGRFNRADTDFHVAVAHASRNRLIERAVADARSRQFLPVGGVFSRLRERADDLHDTIAEAIAAGDGDRAAAAMEAHIEATRSDIAAAVGAESRAVLA